MGWVELMLCIDLNRKKRPHLLSKGPSVNFVYITDNENSDSNQGLALI